MDFIEVFLLCIFRDGIDKYRTTVDDFGRYTTDKIHFLLTFSARSHNDYERLFLAGIMQDFFFRYAFFQSAGVLHIRKFSFLNSFFNTVYQIVKLFMDTIKHALDAQFMFHRQPVVFCRILQTRHVYRTEIHVHQHYFCLYLGCKIETEFTGSHRIIGKVDRYQHLLTMLFFRFFLIDHIFGQPRRTFNDFQCPGQITFADAYSHARRNDRLNQVDIMDASLNSFIFKHIL